MRKRYFYLMIFLICSCGDSKLDEEFDNADGFLPRRERGNKEEKPPEAIAPTLTGFVDVSAADGSASSFPTMIWPIAIKGTNAIDSYEVSIAEDEGSGNCDENDFLGSPTLNWTRMPSSTDFSGRGYKINDADLDGDGIGINVNWIANTDYCFAVRATDVSGLVSDAIFSSSPTLFKYTSCKEKMDHEGGSADGVYSIDVDGAGPKMPYDVYCDMTNNGGGWTLLLNQNPVAGNLFANLAMARNFNQADPENNLYSIIDKTEDFLRNGEYEFYLTWPGTSCAGTPHHWRQASTPHTNSGVTGYGSISTPTNVGGGGFDGLCQSSSSNALLASNCTSGNWWYAVGAMGLYGSGTPGCGNAINHVQLWVR